MCIAFFLILKSVNEYLSYFTNIIKFSKLDNKNKDEKCQLLTYFKNITHTKSWPSGQHSYSALGQHRLNGGAGLEHFTALFAFRAAAANNNIRNAPAADTTATPSARIAGRRSGIDARGARPVILGTIIGDDRIPSTCPTAAAHQLRWNGVAPRESTESVGRPSKQAASQHNL